MSLFLSCIFYFVAKIRKTCYRKKLTVFEAYLLTKGASSWFLLIGSLKLTYATSYARGFESLSNREGLNRFLRHSYPNLVKQLWPVQSEQKEAKSVNFYLPKVSKVSINFELLKVRKMTCLKIYVSPVMEKLEISNLETW